MFCCCWGCLTVSVGWEGDCWAGLGEEVGLGVGCSRGSLGCEVGWVELFASLLG